MYNGLLVFTLALFLWTLRSINGLAAALRRPDGTFVFNGNWAISWSGDYEAAGTTFTYRRQDATAPELITARGPLSEALDIMVSNDLPSPMGVRSLNGFR